MAPKNEETIESFDQPSIQSTRLNMYENDLIADPDNVRDFGAPSTDSGYTANSKIYRSVFILDMSEYLYMIRPFRCNLYARVCGEDLEPDDDRVIIEKIAEIKQCLQKLFLPVSLNLHALHA